MATSGKSGPAPTDSKEQISDLTTARLSVYVRCLTFLESNGQATVSSQELAERFHLNSAQIRKDLAYFGEFGIRGVGYNVRLLKEHLVRTLGLDKVRKIVIAGAGNLGMALADYKGFHSDGFHIAALVDSDDSKAGGMSRSGVTVHKFADLPGIVKREGVEIGIIAVPGEAAQAVYEALVDAGVCAVLNFAPVQIRVREGVKVKSVDLRISLETLSFYLKQIEDEGCATRHA
jgi:redox-sensing transcriptional repressor